MMDLAPPTPIAATTAAPISHTISVIAMRIGSRKLTEEAAPVCGAVQNVLLSGYLGGVEH
jgi:hypothetical protein